MKPKLLLLLLSAFFCVFTADAQVAQWAFKAGGNLEEYGRQVALDANGNVYLAAMLRSTNVDVDPGPGTKILSSNGGKDIMLAKYDRFGTLKWAFNVGGSDLDDVENMTIDHAGNLILTGYFRGTVDFDPGPGVANVVSNGQSGSDNGFGGDIYVAKYDTSGAFRWAFNVGGDGLGDDATGVAVDASNNIIITGFFGGAVDFDPGTGSTILNSDVRGKYFVAKYSPSGALLWAQNAGLPSADNAGYGVGTDAAGNVYTSGYFQGSDINFDPSGGSTGILSSAGSYEGFLAKYSPTGTLLWARRMGSFQLDVARNLQVEASGDVYLIGDYRATMTFEGAPSGFTLPFAGGGSDVFVAKYSSSGNFLWAHAIQGNGDEISLNTTRDNFNNIVIAGGFSSSVVDFDPSAATANLSTAGGYDIFVAKYSPSGEYRCAYRLGGAADDIVYGIGSFDGQTQVITGAFKSQNMDFDPGTGTIALSSNGGDIFLQQFNWSTTPAAGALSLNSNQCGQVKFAFNATAGTAPFTLFISDGTNTYTYSGIQSGVPFLLNPQPSGNTTYSLTGIQDAAQCAGISPGAGQITVTSSLNITHSADVAICPGDSTQLSASGGVTYQWSPASGLSATNVANPKASPAATTTYKVVVTSSLGCKDSAQIIVTVNQPPVATVNSGSISFCPGNFAMLQAGGGGTYQWSPATGLSSATIANPTAAPPATTIYKVVVTNAAGCKDSASVTVVRAAGPTPMATVSGPICAGDSAQLTASGGASYLWSPAATLSNASIANPKAGPAVTTVYKVVVTSAAGCKDSTTATVTVNPKPLVDFLPLNPAICVTDSIQLTASGGGTYLWSPATGLSSTSLANPKASPAATTVYKVVVTGVNGCKDSVSRTLTVNPKPVITLTPGASACAGDSLQLQATGGGTYQWSPAGGLSSPTIANPKAAPAATTTYQVVVTLPATGCKDSASTTLTVKPKPVISLSAPATICAGDSTQLSASGGNTYTWTPAASLNNAAIANPKAGPLASTDYQVLVAGANGCKDSARVHITVNAKPVINLSPATTICQGDSAQLSASGGGTYAWTPVASLNSATIANPKAGPASTTQYQVVVTTAAGCIDSARSTVNVNAKPVVTISNAGPICAGDSVQLNAGGGTNYLWTPAASLNNPSVANPRGGPSTSTTYQVVVSNAAGCKDSATTLVTVRPKPVISLLPVAPAICATDSAQLTATGGGTYQWSPAAGLSSATVANPKASPVATTTYQVLVTGTNGCKDSLSRTLTVNPKPVITITPSTTACAGDSVQLTATGGGTYQWSPATGLSNAAVANPKAAPVASTPYQVTVTTAAGCQDVASMTLNVNPKPVITLSGAATICAGDSTQLSASGGNTYSWTPAASLNNASIPNPKAGPLTTTDYQAVVTGADGCRDSASVRITVNSRPVVTISAPATVCKGDSTQLNASGGTSYNWTPAVSLSNATIASPKAGPATTTQYQVVVTNAAGCKDSSSTTITVYLKPAIVLTPDTRLCKGDTLQLSASGGATYAWTPAASLSNNAIANPKAFPVDTTLYTVVVTTADGCVDSAHTQVNVFRLPLVFQHRDTVLCNGASFTADASLLPGSSAWTWNNGSTQPTQLISAPGTYWVHTQVAGCFNPIRDSITVAAGRPPTVSLGGDRSVCAYDLPLLSFHATDFRHFTWSTGSTDSSIRVTNTGLYGITVDGPCGTASDEILVTVNPCNDNLYFPGAFTPNGDGRNDQYRAAHLPGVTVASYELVIYNRWGELVFRTTTLNAGWDGTYRGKKQDSGVFVWYARYRKRAGEAEQFQKGSFMLMR